MARTTVYNNIISEEKLMKINPENLELLEEFVEYLHTTDKADGTVKQYINDIRICFVWILEKANNKHFTEFNKRDMMKYQNYCLNTLKLSPNRIRRLRASISSLSNFIENVLDEYYPDFRNIINKIPAPTKTTVREKTVLTDQQCQNLLDVLVEQKQYQKACLFALAWASGSRKSELLRFKVSYFTDENIMFGSLYKTPEKIKTKGRGKLGKQINRYVLVNKFKPYFDLWMEERKQLNIDCDELFVAIRKDGNYRPMEVSHADYIAKKFGEFLNVDFYFHCMRHNFTTGLSQAGVPALVIKEIVGWNSVEMVSVYDDTEIDDKLGDFFGADGIKKQEKKSLSDL